MPDGCHTMKTVLWMQRDKTITQNVLWNVIFMNVFSQSDDEGAEWKWLMSSLLSRTRWRTILCSSCQMSWRSTWRTGRRSLFASTAAPLSRYGNACDSQSKLKLAASAASLITKGEIHFSSASVSAHAPPVEFNRLFDFHSLEHLIYSGEVAWSTFSILDVDYCSVVISCVAYLNRIIGLWSYITEAFSLVLIHKIRHFHRHTSLLSLLCCSPFSQHIDR